MKIRNVLIFILVANIFILTIYQRSILGELDFGKKTKIILDYRVEQENNKEEVTEVTYYPSTVSIMLTNSGNIYHKEITLKNNGNIKVLYGKKQGKKKVFEKEVKIKDKFFSGSNKIKIESGDYVTISDLSDYKYPGCLWIYKEDKGYVIVNEIEVEKYLYGVVTSEMPESFEEEALKAQAICARTFTYAHTENEKYKKYNAIMDDTVSYQVYGNKNYSEKIKNAVDDTKDIVMYSDGNLINAYYFSTSCGYTTNYSIWGNDKMEYLKSKYVSNSQSVTDVSTKDYFKSFIKQKDNAFENECAFYRWNVTIKKNMIENKIYEIKKVLIGNLESIEIEERGAGGIVRKITFQGSVDKCEVTNQLEIRKILCPYGRTINLNDGTSRDNITTLPSAFFIVEKVSDDAYQFTGGGYGHGCGMSQYGANEMAKSGIKYKDILEFFYTGISCDHIYIR